MNITTEQLQVLGEVLNRAPSTLAERIVITQFFAEIEQHVETNNEAGEPEEDDQ